MIFGRKKNTSAGEKSSAPVPKKQRTEYSSWPAYYNLYKEKGICRQLIEELDMLDDFREAPEEQFMEVVLALPNLRAQTKLFQKAYMNNYRLSQISIVELCAMEDVSKELRDLAYAFKDDDKSFKVPNLYGGQRE